MNGREIYEEKKSVIDRFSLFWKEEIGLITNNSPEVVVFEFRDYVYYDSMLVFIVN